MCILENWRWQLLGIAWNGWNWDVNETNQNPQFTGKKIQGNPTDNHPNQFQTIDVSSMTLHVEGDVDHDYTTTKQVSGLGSFRVEKRILHSFGKNILDSIDCRSRTEETLIDQSRSPALAHKSWPILSKLRKLRFFFLPIQREDADGHSAIVTWYFELLSLEWES